MNELAQREKELTYPGNQHYDVETLQPYGEESSNRFPLALQNAPELMQGGETLLDIGSNKGMVCLHLRDKFKKIVGYEVAKEYYQFAEDVRKYHNIENVTFINGEMRDIPLDKNNEYFANISYAQMMSANPLVTKYFGAFYDKYDVVYCGSVHHHFYKDALLYGAKPFLWAKKLMALADKYIILDGPMDMNDTSVRTFSIEGNWTDEQKNAYNFENIKKQFEPNFELIRVNKSERRRYTAVFKRVMPDIKYILDSDVVSRISSEGMALKANPARPEGSMFKIGNSRVKYDIGLLTDGMLFILNSLPEHFAKTKYVIITKDGERIGDISEWIPNKLDYEDENNLEIFYHKFISMNRDLAAIGLIEPHFKCTDYKYRDNETGLVDVDVDMIMPPGNHRSQYINNWVETKCQFYPKRNKEFNYIKDHWNDKNLYHILSKGI